MDSDIFRLELSKFLNKFDAYSKSYFAKKIKETKKYSPVVSDFYKKLEDFSQGGKKLRAFLVWLGYQVGHPSHKASDGKWDEDLTKILPISLAFEMTQNFLLIHDDIMDNSDLRRSKPTVHKVYEKKFGPSTLRARQHYGESMAITLGDIASMEAFRIIADSDFDNQRKVEAQRLFAEVLLETAYGQGLDVEYANREPSFRQIMQIADLKAARYSVIGPLTIGATLAGAEKEQIKALSRYGAAVGLAFQLADDILGVFGEEKELGKSTLSDMREGKNTLLIHKTREMIKGTRQMGGQAKGQRDKVLEIERLWGNRNATKKDLDRIRKIIEESGALAWCKAENRSLIEKAKKGIGKITSDESLQIIFSQLADFVISRRK